MAAIRDWSPFDGADLGGYPQEVEGLSPTVLNGAGKCAQKPLHNKSMAVQQVFNCPKCSQRLPYGAKACPHCGYSFVALPVPAPVVKIGHPQWYSDLPQGFRFVMWLVIVMWIANTFLQIYGQFEAQVAQARIADVNSRNQRGPYQ